MMVIQLVDKKVKIVIMGAAGRDWSLV